MDRNGLDRIGSAIVLPSGEEILTTEENMYSDFGFFVRKRKCNQPKRWGSSRFGKVPEGEEKYKLIYKGIKWIDISKEVRERDGKCVRCGSKKHLEADHFHPACYQWIKRFFRKSYIQTLCSDCHKNIPSMVVRKENWIKYKFL